MASELHLGDSNWKFSQVGYPVDMSFYSLFSVWKIVGMTRNQTFLYLNLVSK